MRLFTVAMFTLTMLQISVAKCRADEQITQRIERKIAVQSAVAAVARAVEQVADKPSADQIEKLSRAISADVSHHHTREQSMQLAQQETEKNLRIAFAATTSGLLKDASVGLKSPVTPAEIDKHLGNADQAVGKTIGTFSRDHFKSLFSEARSRAVARQRDNLQITIATPTQQELEAALKVDADWNHHRMAFAKKLHSMAASSKQVLFEENDAAIDDEIERVLTDVGRQVQSQFDAARAAVRDGAVPVECITVDAIRSHALRTVNEALDLARNQSGTYRMFPAVLELVEADAKKLEGARLRRFVEQTDLPIDRPYLSKTIGRDITAHRSMARSKEVFRAMLTASTTDYYSAEYVRQAGLNPDTARAAEPFIEVILREETNSTAVVNKLDTTLQSALIAVRAEISARQVKRLFPQLTDSWRPTDQDISALFDSGQQLEKFDECLRLLGATNAHDATRDDLLEESERAVLRTIRKLSGQAVAALKSQLLLLSKMETKQSQQLKLDVAGGVSKERIVAAWTGTLTKEWSKQAASTAFSKLFPRTHAELEKSVSKYYDAITRQIEQRVNEAGRSAASIGLQSSQAQSQGVAANDQETATASTPPPAGSSGGDARDGGSGDGGGKGNGGVNGTGVGKRGSGSKGKKKTGPAGAAGDGLPPDCILRFASKGSSHQCVAQLAVVNSEVTFAGLPAKCDFDPSDISGSASRIAETSWPTINAYLTAKLEKWSARRTDQEPFTLRIHLVVASDSVRHQMRVLVRTQLESRLQAWKQKTLPTDSTVDMSWSDAIR